jgi:hypothetical protein
VKKLFTILCAVLLTLAVSAQTGQGDSRFGIVAGLNVAYPVGDDMEDLIDDFDDIIDGYDDNGLDAEGGINPRYGIHAGGVFDYFLVDNLALSSGLIYSMKGFKIKQKIEGEEYNLSVQLNYIDIPIGVKYAIDGGFEISGGLLISFLASDNVDYDCDGDDCDDYFVFSNDDIIDPDDYEDAFGDDPEGTLMGLQFGVGYTFNEKFNISFKLQKTGNFGEIENKDDNQNLTLQLSTGLYF